MPIRTNTTKTAKEYQTEREAEINYQTKTVITKIR